MQKRLLTSFVLVGTITLVLAAGCGGDDETAAKGTAGSAGSAGSAASGGNAGSGTGGTTGGTTGGGSGGNVGGTMGSPEPTGSTCQMPSDCYANLDTTELSGPVECIDKVDDGYCTHECETDDDCCALEGECRTGFKQVCAPFENTDKKYCFLSCEDEDLVPAGGASSGGASAVDANEYCEREANPRFACRSTGGGNDNRQVCLPDAGAGGAPNNQGGAGGMGTDAGGAGGAGGVSAGGVGTGGAGEPTDGGASNAGNGGAP